MADEKANNLEIGRSLGHYRILKKLGAGGMGEVYLAEDTRLRRKVALKFLLESITRNKDHLRRFEQEAFAASALNHPNILTIYEFGIEGETYFLAAEFVDGETLRERMKREPPGLREVLDIAVQIANALCTAHEAKIVHRDIKPENLMIRPDGFVKILDFGLAKLIGQKHLPINLEDETEKQSQTAEGVILGTVRYMSPEQAKGEKIDARTDIFSLGVVIYEAVAGRLPFDAGSFSETMTKLLHAEPQPLARFAPDVPAELQRIVSKMLRKNKDERYQTMKGLLADLKDLRENLAFGERLEKSHSSDAENETKQFQATTGDANKQNVETQHSFSQKIKQHKPAALAALATFVIALAIVGYFAFAPQAPITSVAVLPFENGNNDANLDYLSDGISESLIDRLAQLPQLKVIARNSSFRYRGQQVDLKEIAGALGVRAIITGRIAQRGDNLNVRVEMIDAAENRQLWSEQYNRKLSDVQAVQQDIAQTASEKLRLRLTGEEQKSLTKRDTDNTEAYQLYLKCTFFWNKFTPEAELTAIDYCTQAIAKDPNFIMPYIGLVYSYQVLANNGWMRPHDAYPKANAAVAKALEIDPNNFLVQDAMANNLMFYDWNWTASEIGFRRTIEIEPNYWHSHELYSYLLSLLGRHDEAIAEIRRAQEIDPLSLIAYSSSSKIFYHARQYERALEQARKALELDAGFPLAYHALGKVYVEQGKYEEAIAAFKQAINASGRTSNLLSRLGHAYAVAGKRDEALKILAELKEASKQKYVSPHDMAILYTGLGDKEQAFAQLEMAYQERNAWMMFLKVEPVFDPLRSDPRFADLLRRMNFP